MIERDVVVAQRFAALGPVFARRRGALVHVAALELVQDLARGALPAVALKCHFVDSAIAQERAVGALQTHHCDGPARLIAEVYFHAAIR